MFSLISRASRLLTRRRVIRAETQKILTSLAGKDFTALRQKYSDARWSKFLQIKPHLPIGIMWELNLIGTPPLRVLDIGCGAGLFLYCLKYHGHDAIGTDIDDPLLAGLAEIYGVDRRVIPVQPFTPLQIEGNFDLITCIQTYFDRPNPHNKHWWGRAEWHYFLSDMAGKLSPQGRIFLRINRSKHDAEVLAALHTKRRRRREITLDRNALERSLRRLAAERPTGSGPENQRDAGISVNR